LSENDSEQTTSDQTTIQQPQSVPVKTTKFCSDCGAEISAKAEICPKCGVRQQSTGKNPIIAVILNLIIAGLGHVYLGRTKRGIVLFLLTVFIALISMGAGWILGVIVCSYDAYQLAQNKPAPFDFLDKYIEKGGA
jgi:TM2 domain-containing membrane protein YozV